MASSQQAKAKPHVLLIPYPAQGHVNPLLRLAKALHSRSFHITFVHTEHNYRRLLRSRGPGAVEGAAGFQFETIPDGLPPVELDATQDIWKLCEATRRTCPGPIRELVERLSRTEGVPPVTCVIADGAMGFVVHVAKEMGLPAYLFFTTSACGFLAYLNFDQLVKRGYVPFKGKTQRSRPDPGDRKACTTLSQEILQGHLVDAQGRKLWPSPAESPGRENTSPFPWLEQLLSPNPPKW